MNKKYFSFNEVKYLPDDYIVLVNIIYLYSALVISDLRRDVAITKLVQNILKSIHKEIKNKRKHIEWVPIKIGDLKNIVEVCDYALLKVKAYNESRILLYDIKYNLVSILYEDITQVEAILDLLENSDATLNHILNFGKKSINPKVKEAFLLLYKIKLEEYYNLQIELLENNKNKELSAINRVLEN